MKNMRPKHIIKKTLGYVLSLFILVSILWSATSCGSLAGDGPEYTARYGSLGRSLALRLVEDIPFRAPGSQEEKATADYIIQHLERLNLQVDRQGFSFNNNGQNLNSENIVVSIPGRGIKLSNTDANDPLNESRNINIPRNLSESFILIGAHYDTAYSRQAAQSYDNAATSAQLDEDGNPINMGSNLPKMVDTDGLDDNAAAVATLLTLCSNLKQHPPAFNVRVVFFGAGHADYAGAKAYYNSLSEPDKTNLYCMINLESIYAGDKVYAHAGQNSVLGGDRKDYLLRQSLYICTDVYYNNYLLTNNGFALYTNQMGCEKNLPGVGPAVYREWTEREGNHSIFDQNGFPVVFFESADYNLESCSDPFRQSSNPYFSGTQGMISGTVFDSSRILTNFYVPEGQLYSSDYFGSSQEFEEESKEEVDEQEDYIAITDPLEIRINNIAFILEEFCDTVPYGLEAN